MKKLVKSKNEKVIYKIYHYYLKNSACKVFFISFLALYIFCLIHPTQIMAEFKTKSITGFVNKNEIGGSNLVVCSAHSASAKVGADGKFNTVVSSEGAQLVFVQDGQNKLRALSVSLPQYSNIIFDAISTAKASVFMTIGILSTDPNEAELRLKTIESLPSFSKLVNYIKNKLPDKPFSDLNKSENYNTILEQCINEFIQKIK